MALKVVNTESLDAVANALNEAAGKSGKLVFPDEYISTAKRLSAGGGGNPLQELIDARGLKYLYYANSPKNITELAWLQTVDTSKVTDVSYMFSSAGTYINTVPLFDVSSVQNARSMFENGDYIATIPCFHFKSPCNAQAMFANVARMTECPIIMDECINATQMFYYSNYLEHFPTTINTSKCTTFYYMFGGCTALSGDVILDVSSAKDSQCMDYVFYNAATRGNALNVVLKNSHNVTRFNAVFQTCKNLVSASFDMRSATYTANLFSNCVNLTNLTLKNIKTNLQVGSGTSYGHLLTVDSLVGLCYELRQTSSTKTLTIGSANLAKLASVYVRSIEITDAMRAEDDLIDEKLPFERCESTDEGATLITDYVVLKNWKLA